MFVSASECAFSEIEKRKNATKGLLKFGVSYLDDALKGIMPKDLVLIGAPSGIGKTQLCCGIALSNLEAGKRVHYIALEAEEHEIERRLKYQLVANAFYRDVNRPRLSAKLSFDRWLLGEFIDELWPYEEKAAEFFKSGFQNLYLYYKQGKFGVVELIEQVAVHSQPADLIIIDHVHYFDFEDDNENRAIREIAKIARTLALEQGKPIILVAHLRKRDRHNQEIAAGLDEFHGSSDLTKIATKVITIAPGSVTDSGTYETYFRTPKSRWNGGAIRYLGRLIFDPRTNSYAKEYKIGFAECTRNDGFEELADVNYPDWARKPQALASRDSSYVQRKSGMGFMQGGQRTFSES